jgi:hypothetical protein
MGISSIYSGKPKTAAGGVYVGETDIEGPTDAATSLPIGFSPLGRVNEDGLSRSIDRSTTQWKDWSGSVYKTVTSEHSVKYTLTFLEATLPVLEEVFGSENVTQVDTLITVQGNASDRVDRSWVFDMADGNAGIREYVPAGQIVVAAAETVFNTEAPISFTVEIEAHEDADGQKFYTYIESDAFAPVA